MKSWTSDDGASKVAVAFLLVVTRLGRGNHCGARWYSAGAIMGRNERAGGAVLKLAEDLVYHGCGQHYVCFDTDLALNSL